MNRILFADINVLNGEKIVSEKINSLLDNGDYMVFFSDKNVNSLKNILKNNNINHNVIISSFSGGYIYDLKKDYLIRSIVLAKTVADKIYKIASESMIDIYAFTEKCIVSNKETVENKDVEIVYKEDLNEYKTYKIVAFSEDKEKLEKLKKQIKLYNLPVRICNTEAGYLEFHPKFSGKETSVVECARYLRIPLVNTVGYSENEFDMLMLNSVNASCTSKIASDSVRKSCKFVTSSNDNSKAIVEVIDKYFSIGYFINDHLWLISEGNLYVSFICGSKKGILVDTGLGNIGMRKYIDDSFNIPYIIVNSHAHVDHIIGNYQFFDKEIYMNERDMPLYKAQTSEDNIEALYNGKIIGEKAYEGWLKNDHQVKFLSEGMNLALGDINVAVCELPGHTAGSLGLLIKEEKILVSGDAFNENAYIFFEESCGLNMFISTIQRALNLPFEQYVYGHSYKVISKRFLNTHLYNAQHIDGRITNRREVLGHITLCTEYSDEYGTSRIYINPEKENIYLK